MENVVIKWRGRLLYFPAYFRTSYLWTTGQPATEGHVLDYSAEEVVDAIESCYDDGDEDVEDEEELE